MSDNIELNENSSKTIDIGTSLYDLNKQLVKQNEKELKSYELKQGLKKVKSLLTKYPDKYFMLLCREQYDFTLFVLNNKESETLNTTLTDLQECLTNRGSIYSIEFATESQEAIEVWINVDEEMRAYYFFPYDLGVIENGD
jgi:hypothetical protein